MGMRFNVADLQQQFLEIESIARQFLGRGSEEKLSVAARQLDMIAKAGRTCRPWQIDRECPLWTIPNKGSHEKSGKGKNLVGCLSFIWSLRGEGRNQVELVDLASTIISIHEIDGDGSDVPKDCDDLCVQKWNIDIVTAAGAPGPAFHAQVHNQANVPVPRLPSILLSPADCLDYLLGELFQDCWRRRQTEYQRLARFAKPQQKRLRAVLKEQLAWLDKMDDEEGDDGRLTAWTWLKDQRPADDFAFTR